MPQNIKILIVDDEENSREVLRRLINSLKIPVTITGEAATAEEGYSLAISTQPDLVLLDIQMPKGDGFSLLKRFENVPFEVVFVTSYDQYAINAIKFNALDYLLKPVEITDLEQAIIKAEQRIQSGGLNNNIRIINLLHSLDKNNVHKLVAVHTGDKVTVLQTENIVYIEGAGRYSNLYTIDNEFYTTARYLKDFEVYFGENSSFVRISKSEIINTQYIKDYTKGETCIIRMTTNKTFEVARRKKQEILEKLKAV